MGSDHRKTEGFALTSPPSPAAQKAEMRGEIPSSPTLSNEHLLDQTLLPPPPLEVHTPQILNVIGSLTMCSVSVLWPPEQSIKLRILKSKAAARLRTKSVFGSLVPSQGAITTASRV